MDQNIVIIAAKKNIEEKIESLVLQMDNIIEASFSSAEQAAAYILANPGKVDLIILSSFYEDGIFSYQIAEKIKSKYELPIIFLNDGAQSFNSKAKLKNGDLVLSLPENKTELEIFKYNIKKFINNFKIKQQCQLKQYSLDSLSAHIAVLDQKGVIKYTNKAWDDFGRENGLEPAQSGVGINYLELLEKAAEAENSSDILAGLKSVINQEKDLFTFEYPCHSLFEERWFKLRATPFKGKGAFAAVVAHENITQRKLAEKELEVLNKEYENIFENVQNSIFLLNVETGEKITYQRLNSLEENLTGIKTGAIKGKTPVEAFGEDLGSKIEKRYRKCLRKKESIEYEEKIELPGGLRYWLTKLNPIIIDGKVEKIVGTSLDITESKQKEAKLEAIFKASQNISFIITEATDDKRDSVIREFSPGAENIFGYSREEMIDSSVSKLHSREETRQFPNMHALIEDGKSWSDEVVLVRKNGERFPALFTVFPLGDYADKKLLTLGVTVDISERKEVEEKLKKSKKLYQGLIESQNDLIVRVDSENRFNYVNDAYCELFGKNRKELIGSKFTPLVHEDDLESTLEAMKDLNKPPYRAYMEQRAMTVDGWRWISWEDNAILNEMGEITEIQGVGRDITELKETEKALKESQRKLEQLIAQTTAVIYSYQIVDGELEITYLNENVENILGFKPEDFIGEEEFHLSCVHPEDREILKEKIEKTTIKDISIDEYRFKDKQGNYYWLYDQQKVISRKGGVIKVIGSWLDYTAEHEKHKEKIDKLLYKDVLTGLNNRKYFEENEIIKVIDQKNNLPLSVIKADINGLKLINDSYGDELGDQYLIKATQILEESVPEQAVMARWGGDEFLILLPKTDKVEVQAIMNEIRTKMDRSFIKDIPISMGLGTATKFDIGQEMETVLTEADDLMYQNKLLEKRSAKSKIVESIINALAAKSDETKDHAVRMSKNARELGRRLGLDNSELDKLSLLAKLHDIGKTTISEEILTKPGKLNQKEWEIMKTHPKMGFKIASASSEFAVVAEEILSHHERWDGSGYPRGLKGEEIPYLARIISIIDAYDVMTNERPYTKAINEIDALAEVKRCAGSQFDPQIAEEFIAMLSGE
ncbi:PAS domain S-box protein [Halanaerobium hydrogeniformans]|uniref:Diguanylate cyclase and metal dependent phosphohydrolase n=1 Tax=Halanaerobium hydrogeniformans TaxID=656519 RepID=E4RPB7_HALHG|nr:PAS domain S-box protein [Halanaerobium hydrogeniformans]ADQ13802.1 diguanylate cyclase and metal dependent phosphohydrolase [Halanaerobium hydrogeniformans]